MALFTHTTQAALLVALSLALAGCGKQEEPAAAAAFPAGNADKPLTLAECAKLPDPKPADDSAASRATAVSQGVAAREACKKEVAMQDKPNADLARIREIKEKEDAERTVAKQSEEEFRRGLKEGGAKPLQGLKY